MRLGVFTVKSQAEPEYLHPTFPHLVQGTLSPNRMADSNVGTSIITSFMQCLHRYLALAMISITIYKFKHFKKLIP